MSLAFVHDDDLQTDSEPDVSEADQREADQLEAKERADDELEAKKREIDRHEADIRTSNERMALVAKIAKDFRRHFNIESSPSDSSNIDDHGLRSDTIANDSSTVGQGTPQTPAKKRARHGERERAETPAARTAQARRDTTIKIQENMEALIPYEYLQAFEEEKVIHPLCHGVLFRRLACSR